MVLYLMLLRGAYSSYSCKVARFPFLGYAIIKRFGYIVLKNLWKKNLISYLLELFREQSNFSSYFISRNLCGDFRVVLISRFRQKAMFLCISISCFDQVSLLCVTFRSIQLAKNQMSVTMQRK